MIPYSKAKRRVWFARGTVNAKRRPWPGSLPGFHGAPSRPRVADRAKGISYALGETGLQTGEALFQVVTCFLRRDGKVLLLRRSGRVSTFRGRWAAVSGGIESDPLSQAYQEIEEECGYTREELRLVRCGEPLDAEGEGRRFRVHPFLFDLLTDADPHVNWENLEYRWADPAEIPLLETVPRLSETWHRVAEQPGE